MLSVLASLFSSGRLQCLDGVVSQQLLCKVKCFNFTIMGLALMHEPALLCTLWKVLVSVYIAVTFSLPCFVILLSADRADGSCCPKHLAVCHVWGGDSVAD